MYRVFKLGGAEMLGLRKDCSLLIGTDCIYITVKGYNIPIPWHMAFILSLMDGTRDIEIALCNIVEIGLASETKKEQLLNDFILNYSVYLEEYKNGFKRNDIVHQEELIKSFCKDINTYAYPLPRAMVYHVTSSCDKACKYCYLDAQHIPLESDILTKKEVYKIIDQLRELAVSKIIYTGGEPFVRSDLMDILQYSSQYGIYNSVTTKHYFSEKEAIQLGKIKMVKIALSYDCHINSIADYLSGCTNHADKMDKSIRYLLDNNVKLSIESVVTGINADVMEDFLYHLKGMGVKNVDFHRYVNAGGRHDDCLNLTNNQWDNTLKLLDNDNKIVENVRLYNETIEKVGEENATLNTGCVNGLVSFSMLPNGKVVLCDHMPSALDCCYGDLKTQSIEDIWNSRARQEIIYPSQSSFADTPCGKCDDFAICLKKTACRKQSMLQHGNALKPSSITYDLCLKYRKETIKDF